MNETAQPQIRSLNNCWDELKMIVGTIAMDWWASCGGNPLTYYTFWFPR